MTTQEMVIKGSHIPLAVDPRSEPLGDRLRGCAHCMRREYDLRSMRGIAILSHVCVTQLCIGIEATECDAFVLQWAIAR
jgi:hypothetical protein